jgi:hypothetical protein
LLWDLLSIPPEDIVNEGPFFQTKTKRREGCQIDYLIQSKFGALYIIEIKFSRNPIPLRVVSEVRNKIATMSCGPHQSFIPVLIYVNGIEESVLEEEFFARVINFSQLMTD